MEAAVTPRSELSSILTVLDDLSSRVEAIAERNRGSELDWLAVELFEAERSLGAAKRRLGRTVERLR